MGISQPSERLAVAMKKAGVPSAAELHRKLDDRTKKPALSSIRAYLNGGRNPPLDIAIRIGRVLNASGQWIFDGSGRIEDENPPLPGRTIARLKDRDVQVIQVPLVSWVSASELADPGHTEVEPERWLPIIGLGRGDYFALEVKGDSMDLLSPDGSTIVVDRSRRDLQHNKPYVVINGNETTYKLWDEELRVLQPWSSNRIHRAIPVREASFLVIGQVRRTMLDFS